MINIATVEELDNLINHPKIFPSTGIPVGSHGTMSKLYDNPKNCAFTCMYGGMIFNHEGGNIFSGHFLFIPGTRGSDITTAARGMLQEMFTNHAASVIKGYPPRDNRAVRVIGNALGFRKIPDAVFVDDFGRECETYEVRQKWLL